MRTRWRRGCARAWKPASPTARVRGVEFTQATQANSVFACLPPGVADRLRERFQFYDWDAARGEVRWVCSFDTQPQDIDAFVADVARLASA